MAEKNTRENKICELEEKIIKLASLPSLMLNFSRDSNKCYLLNFESAKEIAADSEKRREFSEIVESSREDAIRFTDLKIRDLLIYPGIGIYIMIDGVKNELEYVGKITSRSFLGRIPAHFDCRRHAKDNTVLQRHSMGTTEDDLSKWATEVTENLRLLLINFTYDRSQYFSEKIGIDEEYLRSEAKAVKSLEGYLIVRLKPRLQNHKHFASEF